MNPKESRPNRAVERNEFRFLVRGRVSLILVVVAVGRGGNREKN